MEKLYATVNCYWYLRMLYSFVNYYSLQLLAKYKWSHHFITTHVIFWHFFSVGVGNELLWVFYNFNYPIHCTKSILSTFLLSSDFRSEGSIAIVKKLDFDFLWFFILHHSHALKMCFRKNVCVCVCLSA